MQLLPFLLLRDHRRRMLIHVLSPRDSRQLWELLEAPHTTTYPHSLRRAWDSRSHHHSKHRSRSSPRKKPTSFDFSLRYHF